MASGRRIFEGNAILRWSLDLVHVQSVNKQCLLRKNKAFYSSCMEEKDWQVGEVLLEHEYETAFLKWSTGVWAKPSLLQIITCPQDR